MNKKKRKYSDAFKLEAVRMSEPSAQSVAEVALLLGIKPRKLAMWHARFGHEGEEDYPRNIIARLEEEARALRTDNNRLHLENAHLKKALSFSTAALKSQLEGV